MSYQAEGPNQMKVVETSNVIFVYRNGLHKKSSHDHDQSAFLKVLQQDVVRDAVRLSPLVLGATDRRNLKILSPQQFLPS